MKKELIAAVGLAAVALSGKKSADTGQAASGGTWLDQMRAAVDVELTNLNAQARDLVVAHAAYESGDGNGRASKRGFNVFNVTAGSWWKTSGGRWWVDVAGDSDGSGRRIDQEWRIYPSLRAAVADYWQFLGVQNSGRYLHARQSLEAANLREFVRRLSAAGYFELEAKKYEAGLSRKLIEVRQWV